MEWRKKTKNKKQKTKNNLLLLLLYTSWFKLISPNVVRLVCDMQYLLECHMFSIILTAMSSGSLCDSQFLVDGLLIGLALVANTCPHRPKTFKKVNNGQAFPSENKKKKTKPERVECPYSKACL